MPETTKKKRVQRGPNPPCKKCGGRVMRIHRSLLFKILTLGLPVRRYRCLKCGRMIYRFE